MSDLVTCLNSEAAYTLKRYHDRCGDVIREADLVIRRMEEAKTQAILGQQDKPHMLRTMADRMDELIREANEYRERYRILHQLVIISQQATT